MNSGEKHDTISFFATMGSLVLGVLVLVMDILRDAMGLTYPGLFGAIMEYSSIWLPLLMLVAGYAVGKRAKVQEVTAERIAELEKENAGLKSSIEVLKNDTVERFLGELPFVKLMAMDSFDHDGITDPHNFIFDYLVDEDILDCANDFFIQESLVPEGTRWVLRPDIRYAISDDPSLLRFAREARDRGDEGDYAMFTVLDGCVARDDAMYMERMGFYVPEE